MGYLVRSFGWIFTFVFCVGTCVFFMSETLFQIASHNYPLNGLIFICIFCGIFFVITQMYQIYKEQVWLNYFEQGKENFPGIPKPKILAPLTFDSKSISRATLSSIEARLEDIREINRYFIGLLIFLGLLGTFWGLSKTISAITGVISDINISSIDVKDSMNALKQGLASPLKGMGTAFSCSLFGLSGSLILGFLDLQIGRAISSFFKVIEKKLSHKISDQPIVSNNGPAFTQGLLEQIVEVMGSVQTQVKRAEENRISLIKTMQNLSESLVKMNEQSTTQQNIIKKIAQNQIDLQENMKNMLGPSLSNNDFIKDFSKKHNVLLEKIIEEIVSGRDRMTDDITSEIRLVSKTLSALANND